MSSLIPGYEYDIFISYRQKDNKHDGWVTEFVNNLKGELESTFKEEISVYFDINPHDGLLETHDVDASLKDKLKCLVFIPIISRTYCDPKSFAWEHEFKAFVEEASKDQIGLKVKLLNGNVASRVLPVRIYDLDNVDIKLCESVLGGLLRGIEFIYKEPGVNRPLKPKYNEEKNLNNTNYRNQINKVGNAIKDIISGLITEPLELCKEKIHHREPLEEVMAERLQVKPIKASKQKLMSRIAIFIILIIATVFVYPKIFKPNTLEKLRSSGERISVAVMPFQNLTNDTTLNVWQNGIQDILITYLSNFQEDFRVRQVETINKLIQSKGIRNYASITPDFASAISRKLDANVFISGSIIQEGSILRVNAQLTDSKSKETVKSFEISGTAQQQEIFHIADSLKMMTRDFLLISSLKKQLPIILKSFASTNSPIAFSHYINGANAFYKRDYQTAIKSYLQAVALDSNFILAERGLAVSYRNQSIASNDPALYNEGKKWCLKYYKKIDQLTAIDQIRAERTYADFFGTPYEVIKYARQLLEYDDQSPHDFYNLGVAYNALYQFDKAIPEYEKSLELYKKWDSKPVWVFNYTNLGRAYHNTGQFKKEKRLYKQAEKDFPVDYALIQRQAILSLTLKDTIAANRYIEKYISVRKENASSEADIASGLAQIYEDADMLDKAEVYYRHALSLEPENPTRSNDLAWFLINRDRNINEGLELVDKALKSSPDNYNYTDCKGWGLFKKSRYEEALKYLERSSEIRPRAAVYLHLEEVKKAVAGQK